MGALHDSSPYCGKINLFTNDQLRINKYHRNHMNLNCNYSKEKVNIYKND